MKFRPFFQEIVTTEVNSVMARRLRERGFACVQTPEVPFDPALVDRWAPQCSGMQVTREALATGLHIPSYSADLIDQLTFDVVSCFNVLDRCPTPKTLLRQIKDILRPNTGRACLHLG